MHAALIRLWADGGKWADVVEIVLVEREGAPVSQLPFVKAMQAALFSEAALFVHYLS
jgi:hypothetical protein